MKTIVIVGGGITGLSTAYYLHKQLKQDGTAARIVLVEASEKLGGKIRTVHREDYIMESGADSVVARKTNMVPLLEELGLQDDIVYNETGKSYIFADGELKLIPQDAIFGIPMSIESLATSMLVSAEGKVEALKDLYTPNEHFTKQDSIGHFLEAFLGEELVEKQIAPVLSGVYSGDLYELTLASTLPYLLDYKNEYGSIIQGLDAHRAKFQSGGKKFYSFRSGLSSLIDRMEEQLGEAVEFRKGTKVTHIDKLSDPAAGKGRYRLTINGSGETIEADYVVLSTLSEAAQSLLHHPELDKSFDQLRNSSLISIYIAFDISDDQLPKDGTGFITADNRELNCDACTWTSRKWAHTSASSQLLMRLFYKSTGSVYAEMVNQPEEELLQVARQDVLRSTGIDAEPLHWTVTKWDNTMPNYHIRHPQLVAALEQDMEQLYPGILLAGCSYYGVGIPDCVANGEQTAQRIAEQMAGQPIL
ncbi:oxygen-dependent protoporphyrinogen oxidase [Paenibacillus cellulosilyticus]|uniref:Coproporphyrinogen III oxidase n=1 Tax=Paenibacillus cellulosilyticus TaxID=375489 RepID=A0A2V2YUN6_9BACL|nr:protoporphyrinogen oxidase [Paenibacillus cellulosilyticus]PWW04881.1 oxygen-dependent protoporphyrinogen oxidase [Paenibacillus cellulosilyticus]QKS45988.1 protoporphyrinogen oxidase [Paenibacillus cellulosilyticus]